MIFCNLDLGQGNELFILTVNKQFVITAGLMCLSISERGESAFCDHYVYGLYVLLMMANQKSLEDS